MRRASLDEGSSDKEEERDSDAASYVNRPMKDLSLSDNIKIHIPTRGISGAERGRRPRRDPSSKDGEEGGAGMVLIPPPPSCRGTIPQRDSDKEKEKCHVEATTSTSAADAEGWGDFESA